MANNNPPSGAPGLQRKKRHPLAKIKGGWTATEDAMLIKLVHELGEGNWSPIARALNAAVGKDDSNGRIGKQCRERWNHHLRPDIKKDAWTREEEQMLVKAHQELGNRWSDIAKTIPGRSENAVKNHWNATLRRRDMPDPGPPGPLKLYMQGLNLIRPQNRSRRAQQQPAAQAPARPKGRSSGPNPARGKRRGRHDSDEEDDTTCSSSEEDSIVPEVEEDVDHTGSNWYRHGTAHFTADGIIIAQQLHSGGSGSMGVRPKRLRTTAGAKLRDLVEAEREAAVACGVVAAGGTGSSSRSPTVSGCSTQCDEAESQTAREARACAMATAACSYGNQDMAVQQPSFAGHAAYPPTAIPVPPPPHHMAAAIAAPCESHVAARACVWPEAPHISEWGQQPAPCMDHLQPRRSVVGTDMGRPVACHPNHAQHMYMAAAPAPAMPCPAPVKPEPGSAAVMAQEAADLRSLAMSPAAIALEQALAMSHGSGRLGSGTLPPGLFDADDVELFDILGEAMGNTALHQPHPSHAHVAGAEQHLAPPAHAVVAHFAQAAPASCFHGAAMPPGSTYMPASTATQNTTTSWAQMGAADAEKSGVSRCGSHSSLHSAYSTGPHVSPLAHGSPEKVMPAHPQQLGATAHYMPALPEHPRLSTGGNGYMPQQQASAPPQMWRSASSGTLFSAPPPAPAAPHDSLLAAAPSGSLPMEQPTAPSPSASQGCRSPIMYASADGPGRVLLLTTEPLPTMEALLQQYMPPGPGDIASPLVTVKLGSKGPVRVCIPELQTRLTQAGIPSAGRKAGDAKACTASMVQDMSHMIHYVCRNVVQNYQLDAYVVAVRLGSATPLQDYSVLLAMRGSSSKQVSAAVEALSAGVAPLLC